jgi:hypothetical protein
MDDEVDRFSTSREGVVADDPKFTIFLEEMKEVLRKILANWDEFRKRQREEGDPDNPSIPKKERKAEELYNVVSGDYEIPEDPNQPRISEKVEKWVDELQEDARTSFPSYAECFISENLVRKHIAAKPWPLTKQAKREIQKMKGNEKHNKGRGGISIRIRRRPEDTSYLSMEGLANLVDKKDPNLEASLSRHAKAYKPIRDALMHTALLADEAKLRLTSVFQDIKARVKTLLAEG